MPVLVPPFPPGLESLRREVIRAAVEARIERIDDGPDGTPTWAAVDDTHRIIVLAGHPGAARQGLAAAVLEQIAPDVLEQLRGRMRVSAGLN